MKVFKQICCAVCGGDPEPWTNCQDCGGTTKYEPLDPADLKKLGLDALEVLKELKNQMIGAKKGFELSGDKIEAGVVHALIRTLIDLESGLPACTERSECVPEGVIRARAWEILLEDQLHSAQLRGVAGDKNAPINQLRELEVQARSELEAERDTGKDEPFAKAQDVKGETNEEG